MIYARVCRVVVCVMPNLVPPITTVHHALSHQKRLQALVPDVTFLMFLYLRPTITPSMIKEAKTAGI
jgi:dihydroorotase